MRLGFGAFLSRASECTFLYAKNHLTLGFVRQSKQVNFINFCPWWRQMSGVISGFETVGVTLASNPTTIAGTISVSTGNAVTGLAGPVWTLDNNGLV